MQLLALTLYSIGGGIMPIVTGAIPSHVLNLQPKRNALSVSQSIVHDDKKRK